MAARKEMWGMGLILILVQVILISQNHHQVADAAVPCSQAVSTLLPCVPFLKDQGDITGPCCQGVQSLNALASTKPDRQAVCECLKQAGKSIGIDVGRAKQIPELCHISLAIPVDPSADCAQA